MSYRTGVFVFQHPLRNGEVTVKYRANPAEPDVGIMSAYVDDFEVTDSQGKGILLSTLEDREILNACNENLEKQEPDYPDEP